MSESNWVVLAACLLLVGCGGSEMTRSALQSVQAAAEKAAELEASGGYAEALPLIDGSIKQGGLNPDQLAEAYLLRARCLCEVGMLQEAERDLAAAELGSPSPASWHFSRAILLAKQNKAIESKSEFAKAIRIDPRLKMPK